MITPWREVRDVILAASMMGLTAVPSTFAHGGHGAAHAAKPPHISGGGGGGGQQHASRAPHIAIPNFNNNNFNNNNGNSAGRYRPHASGKAAAHRANAQALNAATPNLTTHNTQNHASLASSRAGTASPTTTGSTGAGLSRSATASTATGAVRVCRARARHPRPFPRVSVRACRAPAPHPSWERRPRPGELCRAPTPMAPARARVPIELTAMVVALVTVVTAAIMAMVDRRGIIARSSAAYGRSIQASRGSIATTRDIVFAPCTRSRWRSGSFRTAPWATVAAAVSVSR